MRCFRVEAIQLAKKKQGNKAGESKHSIAVEQPTSVEQIVGHLKALINKQVLNLQEVKVTPRWLW